MSLKTCRVSCVELRGVEHAVEVSAVIATKASTIQLLPEEHRLATLVTFALTLEAVALDDASTCLTF